MMYYQTRMYYHFTMARLLAGQLDVNTLDKMIEMFESKHMYEACAGILQARDDYNEHLLMEKNES